MVEIASVHICISMRVDNSYHLHHYEMTNWKALFDDEME